VSSGGNDELADDYRSVTSVLQTTPTQLPEDKFDLLPGTVDIATGTGSGETTQLVELSRCRKAASASLSNFDAITASLGVLGDQMPAEPLISSKLLIGSGNPTSNSNKTFSTTDSLTSETPSCIKCNLELIGNVVVVAPTATVSSVTGASCNVLAAFD
jgi:hypothetical protein